MLVFASYGHNPEKGHRYTATTAGGKPTGNRLVHMLALLRISRATGTPTALAPLVAMAQAQEGYVHCTGCPCPSKCPGSTACTQAQAKGKGLDGLQVGYNHRKQRG